MGWTLRPPGLLEGFASEYPLYSIGQNFHRNFRNNRTIILKLTLDQQEGTNLQDIFSTPTCILETEFPL